MSVYLSTSILIISLKERKNTTTLCPLDETVLQNVFLFGGRIPGFPLYETLSCDVYTSISAQLQDMICCSLLRWECVLPPYTSVSTQLQDMIYCSLLEWECVFYLHTPVYQLNYRISYAIHYWNGNVSFYRYPFSADQLIPDCEWEVFLRETASMIIQEQSPKRL